MQKHEPVGTPPGNSRNISGFVLCLILGLASIAQAEETPAPGAADKRIRYVEYRPEEVVKIPGHFGYATHITFQDGEKVVNAVLGDTLAWEVAPVANHVFIKPKEPDGTTNLTVLTDKGRAYTFILATAPKAQKPSSDNLHFRVIFQYPEDTKKRQPAKPIATASEVLARPSRTIRNVAYMACGSEALTPDQAFDDGRFTYLRYAGARSVPAVFVVNADGTEALVDSHMEADTIVVHRLAERFVFRAGKSVGCLVNKRYDARGIETFNGTVAAGVERVVTNSGQVRVEAAPAARETQEHPPSIAENGD